MLMLDFKWFILSESHVFNLFIGKVLVAYLFHLGTLSFIPLAMLSKYFCACVSVLVLVSVPARHVYLGIYIHTTCKTNISLVKRWLHILHYIYNENENESIKNGCHVKVVHYIKVTKPPINYFVLFYFVFVLYCLPLSTSPYSIISSISFFIYLHCSTFFIQLSLKLHNISYSIVHLEATVVN